MNTIRRRFSLRKAPSEEVQTPPPAPACASDSKLSKDPITVAQAQALQCADALQELYLLAAPHLPPTSPLHERAKMARDLLLAQADLSINNYPELVQSWARLPAPPSSSEEKEPEKKKEKRAYFLG